MMGKLIFLVVAVFTIAHSSMAVEWSDLRVHYSLNALNGFFQMPRTAVEAKVQNWTQINSECQSSGDGSNFTGFRYQNPADDGVVLIFDVNGIIAGIQARMDHAHMLPTDITNPVNFEAVPVYQNITENDKTYFIFTAYFVPPEIICSTGRTESDLETEGTARGVWFQKGRTPQDLQNLPTNRTIAISEKWSSNNCWPAMGLHNFYDIESYESHDCTEAQPTFALYNKAEEQLVGFGFSVSGTTNASKYFEHPPTEFRKVIIGEPFPECIAINNDLIGTTAIHVYFTAKPWLLTC